MYNIYFDDLLNKKRTDVFRREKEKENKVDQKSAWVRIPSRLFQTIRPNPNTNGHIIEMDARSKSSRWAEPDNRVLDYPFLPGPYIRPKIMSGTIDTPFGVCQSTSSLGCEPLRPIIKRRKQTTTTILSLGDESTSVWCQRS